MRRPVSSGGQRFAATAALSRNDLVSAERYLGMVNSNKNLTEYNNAMGILMLMKEDYELSKKFLKVAEQSGPVSYTHLAGNLNVL